MMFARRLADLAFQCSIDRNASELIILLKAKGCEVEESDGVVRINQEGFSTALALGQDPLICLTVINFALFKAYWHFLPECKEAFEIVKKEYSQLVKEEKRQKKNKPKQRELF